MLFSVFLLAGAAIATTFAHSLAGELRINRMRKRLRAFKTCGVIFLSRPERCNLSQTENRHMRHIDLEKLEELSPFESVHARRILARAHDEKRKQQKRRDDRRTDEQEAA